MYSVICRLYPLQSESNRILEPQVLMAVGGSRLDPTRSVHLVVRGIEHARILHLLAQDYQYLDASKPRHIFAPTKDSCFRCL